MYFKNNFKLCASFTARYAILLKYSALIPSREQFQVLKIVVYDVIKLVQVVKVAMGKTLINFE